MFDLKKFIWLGRKIILIGLAPEIAYIYYSGIDL